MSDDVALVRMPDPPLAPGYAASLEGLSHFSVADLGAEIVTVAPAEGAGQTAQHFELHRVCDAGLGYSGGGLGDPQSADAEQFTETLEVAIIVQHVEP